MLVRYQRRSCGIHSWRATCGAFERFNDNHGAVATQGTGLQGYACDLFVPVTVVFFDFNVGSGRGGLAELPAQGTLLSPVAMGEEAIVANTLKSFRENVKQEPTDELLRGE